MTDYKCVIFKLKLGTIRINTKPLFVCLLVLGATASSGPGPRHSRGL